MPSKKHLKLLGKVLKFFFTSISLYTEVLPSFYNIYVNQSLSEAVTDVFLSHPTRLQTIHQDFGRPHHLLFSI